MAVEGYATVVNKTTGAGFNCLLVADGWYGGAAYLNFDYAKYTDTFGVTFKK